MKKTLAVLLALAMALSLLPATALAAAPGAVTISPSGTETNLSRTLEITTAEPVAGSIYYTTDGTDPTSTALGATRQLYDAENQPSLNATATVKAVGYELADGAGDVTAVAELEVVVGALGEVVIAPETDTTTPRTVAINAANAEHIYYTTDGNTPSQSSTEYTTPFEISTLGSTTVKALAVKTGSAEKTAELAVEVTAVAPAAPTISADGSATAATRNVTIAGPAGTTIYYTTDGNTPTTTSTEYSRAFAVSANTTVKAIASKDGVSSSVASKTVSVGASIPSNLAIAVSGAQTDAARAITITATNAAAIYYTTDGSNPTSGSTKYSTAFNMPTSGNVVKAIAYGVDGDADTACAVVSGEPVYFGITTVYASSIGNIPSTLGTVYVGESVKVTASDFGPSDWTNANVMWYLDAATVTAGYATIDYTPDTTVAEGKNICTFTATSKGEGKSFNLYCITRDAANVQLSKVYTIPVKVVNRELRSVAVRAGTTTYAAGSTFDYDNVLRVRGYFGSGTSYYKDYSSASGNLRVEYLGTNDAVLNVTSLGSEVKKVRIWLTVAGVSKSTTVDVTVTDSKILSGVTLKDGTTVVSSGSAVMAIDDPAKTITAEPQISAYVDTANLTYSWSSSNEAVATVDSNGVVTPHAIGSTTITCRVRQIYQQAGHNEITTFQSGICTVYVKDVSVSNVTLLTQPTRTTYRVGESYSTAGATARITYSNGSEMTVDASKITASKTTAFDTAGTANIDLYYGDVKLTATPITVKVLGNEQVLQSVTVKTAPTKKEYVKGETFDVTGAVLEATFKNADGSGTETTTDVLPTSYSPTTALNQTGTVNITLNYTVGGVTKSATTAVTVFDATLGKITASLKGGAQTTYHVGQSMRGADVEIEAEYVDSEGGAVLTKTIDGTAAGVSFQPATFGKSNIGLTEVTVKYTSGGYTRTAGVTGITVDNAMVTKLVILTDPAKTVYAAGETLVATGLTAEATFSTGEKSTVTASQMSYSPRTFATQGVKAVTATYTCNGTSVKATFYITVSGTSPSPIGQTGTIVNCKSWVNVRTGPSTAYSKIGTAPKAATYEVLAVSGNWYKVQYTASTVGWIYASYISLTGSGEVVDYTGTATIVNCNSWVNVRSGPSTAYTKLGTAAKGSQYDVTGYVTSTAGNRWWRISYGGQTAYVYGKYISTTGGSTGTTGYGYIYNCTTWVNVRSGAGTNYTKLGTASKYNVYEVLGVYGNWFKIRYSSTQDGYVSKTYFNHVTGTTSARANITTNCTVRSGATTTSGALGTATLNESYVYLTTSGSWYMIMFGNRTGYIPSSCATLS